MDIFKKKFCLSDLVPPIMVAPAKKIKSFLGSVHRNDEPLAIQPFVSPVLNSYSQFNEDLLVDLLFLFKKKGLYLDIGANDPKINSNTKRFYDRGWSGINVEPGPNIFEKLNASRPRDVNLNIGIGPAKGSLTFYQVVGDPTLSSFKEDVAEKMAKKFGLNISGIPIEVMTLVDIFELYVKGRQVDFISIDTEGLDLEVLQSNDWNRFRPSIVIAEIDNNYLKIVGFMQQCNYLMVYNNYHNGIFIDSLTKEESLTSIVSDT